MALTKIPQSQLEDGAVGTAQLANDAVTADKIAAGAVGSSEIATGAVSTDELAANAVTEAKVADGAVTPAKLSQKLTLGTVQASTSGTARDFTGIPAWAKRITINFAGVSTSGASNPLIQLGDAGGFGTTGYLGSGSNIAAAAAASTNYTTGFGISSASAAYTLNGSITLTLLDPATNTWAASGAVSDSSGARQFVTSGSKALSQALDRVRVTTVNGTDTFDLGSINVLID